jgi:hypothetical protein
MNQVDVYRVHTGMTVFKVCTGTELVGGVWNTPDSYVESETAMLCNDSATSATAAGTTI